jgi:RHS repeat-associated protein
MVHSTKNTTSFWHPQRVNFQVKSSHPFGSYPKQQISDLAVLTVLYLLHDILSSISKEVYRYGFNGKETDSETGLQDYGFRIYNPSYGKFLSVDPLHREYPFYTPYQFAGNMPICAADLDGLEPDFKHIRLPKRSYLDKYLANDGYIMKK